MPTSTIPACCRGWSHWASRARIHTTRATCDLLAVMLPDSAHIQEKEAEYANLRRFRKGLERKNKRGTAAARKSRRSIPWHRRRPRLKQLNPVDYDLEIAPHPAVRCTFRDAGHILGSAIVEVWVGEGKQSPQVRVFR